MMVMTLRMNMTVMLLINITFIIVDVADDVTDRVDDLAGEATDPGVTIDGLVFGFVRQEGAGVLRTLLEHRKSIKNKQLSSRLWVSKIEKLQPHF